MDEIKYKICKGCGVEKPHTEQYFEISRNYCRECRNKQFKERRLKQKHEDIIMYKCNQMANSAYSRVFAQCKKNQDQYCYSNLENPYGFKDTGEMASFLYNNFYNDIKILVDNNEVPSVDRINTLIGYTKSNIRILSFKENSERGLETRRKKIKVTINNNETIIFNSVTECAKYFGYDNKNTSRISKWCRNDFTYKPPQGCKFEYIDFQE